MNYLAIILAGLAFWILGAIWYSPVLFQKTWQTESGLTDDDVKKNLAITFGGSLLMMILMSYGLSYIVGAHDAADRTFSHGMFHGALTGVMFAMASMAINYLYQRKSLKLFAIDAIYQILGLAVAGGVLAIML